MITQPERLRQVSILSLASYAFLYAVIAQYTVTVGRATYFMVVDCSYPCYYSPTSAIHQFLLYHNFDYNLHGGIAYWAIQTRVHLNRRWTSLVHNSNIMLILLLIVISVRTICCFSQIPMRIRCKRIPFPLCYLYCCHLSVYSKRMYICFI